MAKAHYEDADMRVESRFWTGWVVIRKLDGTKHYPTPQMALQLAKTYDVLRKQRLGAHPYIYNELMRRFGLWILRPEEPTTYAELGVSPEFVARDVISDGMFNFARDGGHSI